MFKSWSPDLCRIWNYRWVCTSTSLYLSKSPYRLLDSWSLIVVKQKQWNQTHHSNVMDDESGIEPRIDCLTQEWMYTHQQRTAGIETCIKPALRSPKATEWQILRFTAHMCESILEGLVDIVRNNTCLLCQPKVRVSLVFLRDVTSKVYPNFPDYYQSL